MTEGTIDHIGIATTSLDESQQLWTILGFTQVDDQINAEQGVKIRFMHGNTSARIELLEPLGMILLSGSSFPSTDQVYSK